MLKYKKHVFASILDTVEDLHDMLAGASGKNRRIVSLAGEVDADLYLRVYLDGEQIVDISSFILTATAPFLPMDLPIAEGKLCQVGYYNNTGGTVTTQEIVIGYEETG